MVADGDNVEQPVVSEEIGIVPATFSWNELNQQNKTLRILSTDC